MLIKSFVLSPGFSFAEKGSVSEQIQETTTANTGTLHPAQSVDSTTTTAAVTTQHSDDVIGAAFKELDELPDEKIDLSYQFDDIDAPDTESNAWLRRLAKEKRERLFRTGVVTMDAKELARREKELATKKEKQRRISTNELPPNSDDDPVQRAKQRQADLEHQRELQRITDIMKRRQQANKDEASAVEQALLKKRGQELQAQAHTESQAIAKKKSTKSRMMGTLRSARNKIFGSAKSDRREATCRLADPRYLSAERGEAFDILQKLPDGLLRVKRCTNGEEGLLPPGVFIAMDNMW